MLARNGSVNQSSAMLCFVHPLSDQLQVDFSGASSVLKLVKLLFVLPFTITAAFMAAIL